MNPDVPTLPWIALLLAAMLAGAPSVTASVPGTTPGTAPLVLWHSQPASPGQSVLIYGDDLERVRLKVRRLDDGPAGEAGAADPGPSGGGSDAPAIQPREHALKVVLPPQEPPGIFAVELEAGVRRQTVLVNAPRPWWARGARRLDPTPGEDLRVFGLGLGWQGAREPLAGTPPGNPRTRLVLRGPERVELEVSQADLYSIRAPLPAGLAPGDYEVWVHNGCGGAAGWSRCDEPVRVRRAEPWPSREFNALHFGARGDGIAEDQGPVQAALDAAGQAGGGVVWLPSGQYRFHRPLRMPRRVLLKGAGRDSTLLYWSNRHFARLRGIVHGEAQFGLEDMTLAYVGAERGIENMAEVEGGSLYSKANRPPWWQEGDITLRRLVIRWSPYGARPGWGQLSDTLDITRQLNFESLDAAGTGVAVWLCGRDIRIEDCDIHSGGFPLLLAFMSDGSLVRNNTLRTGRGGLVWAQRGRKAIWEDNQMLGADNMSRAGWSTKAHPYYDEVYFRGNTVAFAHSADYEIVGSDGASPVYYGGVASTGGTSVRLRKPVRSWPFEPEGHLAFVLAGRGKGQARTVVRGTSDSIEIDRPWDVTPDDTSVLGINHSLRRWLMVGNRIADGDSMQMYGLNHEVVFAENQLERVGGSSEAGLRFLAFQHTSDGPEAAEPSFFSQMLGNRMVAPRLDMRRFESGTAAIELSGGDIDSLGNAETPCLMNAAVLRGNEVRGGKILVSVGGQRPFRAEDLLIEDNRIIDAPEGLDIGDRTAGVLLRRNRFEGVRRPLVGAGIRSAWIEPGRRVEYWFGALEGVIGRLATRNAVDLRAFRREAAGIEGGDPDSDPRWAALKARVAREVAGILPPPHHPDLAEALFGVRVLVDPSDDLQEALQTGSGGGNGFRVRVDHGGTEPVEVRVEPEWPPGWSGDPAGTMARPGGATFPLPLRIPPGVVGTHASPARVRVSAGGSEISWPTTLRAGRGRCRDWLVVGPEEPVPGTDPGWLNTPSDRWDWEKPVRIGSGDQWWRRITGSGNLEFARLHPRPPGGKPILRAAYAVTAIEARTAAWVELTASLGGPGRRHELQFLLDGRELQDLRLGRETWSPKRLPLRLKEGRHVILVVARSGDELPEVSLEIREMDDRGGGRIYPVAPWARK